jgi:hypothetical protein
MACLQEEELSVWSEDVVLLEFHTRICVNWCCTLWEILGSQCGDVNTTAFCNVTPYSPVAIYGQYEKKTLAVSIVRVG